MEAIRGAAPVSWCHLTFHPEDAAHFSLHRSSSSWCLVPLLSSHRILTFFFFSWVRTSLHLEAIFITTATIIIIFCSHVRLRGHNGVRRHCGADRAGRGGSHHPGDLWSSWQQRAVCQRAAGSSGGRPGFGADRSRGVVLTHSFFSILCCINISFCVVASFKQNKTKKSLYIFTEEN